jgi:uncharacterized protein (TIGR00290 family)
MGRRQVLVSWSGGKDSALALAALREDAEVDVVGLFTSVTRDYDRISIHGVRRELLSAQGRALGLPIHEIVLEPSCSNADYERAFHEALASARARHPALSAVAFGDLFLADVRAYRERLLERTGIVPLFPLWGQPTSALAERCVASGIVARLVCVDTTQLDGAFAGRAFDRKLLSELPAGVDPCGERGEFHTFVSGGPGFREPVPYALGDVVRRDERFVYQDLVPFVGEES